MLKYHLLSYSIHYELHHCMLYKRDIRDKRSIHVWYMNDHLHWRNVQYASFIHYMSTTRHIYKISWFRSWLSKVRPCFLLVMIINCHSRFHIALPCLASFASDSQTIFTIFGRNCRLIIYARQRSGPKPEIYDQDCRFQ